MKKQRNKFLTFMLALCPGAAHMYMGFMIRGLSFMSSICFVAVAAILLDSSIIIFIFPLIWFYAFFDAINLNGMDDETFRTRSDEPFYTYLMNGRRPVPLQNNRYSILLGVIIIIAGSIILFENILPVFYMILPYAVIDIIDSILSRTPRFLIGMVILWLGIKLISGRKKEVEHNEK